MKSVFEKIIGFLLVLFVLWLLFMFLGWVWDHKGTIFLLVVGVIAIGVVVIFLSNTDTSISDESTIETAQSMLNDQEVSAANKTKQELRHDDEQVLTPDIKLEKTEVVMSELTYMLQIIDPEYVQSTFIRIYADVESKVGRDINQTEKALVAAAIFIGLTQAQNDSNLRIKKSKSLARASSLAVMRSLAFDIDSEASTGLFREKLNISQAKIDKEIINTIDNNLSDSDYSKSTSRVVLLATTDFLDAIGLDVWKNKLDVDLIESNVATLLKNLLGVVAGEIEGEEQRESYILFRMSLDLSRAYRLYNQEADDFSALYYIS